MVNRVDEEVVDRSGGKVVFPCAVAGVDPNTAQPVSNHVALRVEGGLEAIADRRTVVSPGKVVFAGPDYLYRCLDQTRYIYSVKHIIGLQAPAESTSETGQ